MTKIVSLNVKCPKCRLSLMDFNYLLNEKPSIKLNIRAGEERGIIHLCSIYGCYDHESNITIPKNVIAQFTCPHCNQILNSKEDCDECSAPMVPFILEMGGKVSICSRNGCQKHYVAFEDLSDTLRKFYDEYGF